MKVQRQQFQRLVTSYAQSKTFYLTLFCDVHVQTFMPTKAQRIAALLQNKLGWNLMKMQEVLPECHDTDGEC